MSSWTPSNPRQVWQRLQKFQKDLQITNPDKGASLVGVHDADGHFTSDNLEDVLAELALRVGGGASNTVIWAPDAEGDGDGYYHDWTTVVSLIQGMTGPTFIKILWDISGSDPVELPGGTWQLNNTTLVGVTYNYDTDTSYRGYQNLVYVAGNGDQANPTWLKSCIGLKDMFFRSSDNNVTLNGSEGTVSSVVEGVVTFTKGGESHAFTSGAVGKPIRIGHISPYASHGSDVADPNNSGFFVITEVVDATTIRFLNPTGNSEDANNGSIGWSLCSSAFIVLQNEPNQYPTFTLDNTDFRYGGDYDWGSLFVGTGVGQFIYLQNGASIRWYSTIVEGNILVQSDGSGAWVGSIAFAGRGGAEVYPMSGCQVRTFQPAIGTWTLHQPYTVFLPDNEANWSSVPSTIHDALNELASRIKALEP